MFCENCGNKLADGERFCANCGSPVAAAPQNSGIPAPNNAPAMNDSYYPVNAQPQYAPQSAPQPQYAPHFDVQQQKPPKKPANKKVIIGVIAAAVAAVAAFVIIALATGLFSGKPKDDIASLEKASISNVFETYGEKLDPKSAIENGALSLKLEPGQALKTLLSSQGVDISWLNDLKLDIATDMNGNTIGERARLTLNGTELATLEMFIDMDNGTLLMGLDGLSDSYVKMDFAEMSGLSSMSGLMESLKSFNLDDYDLDLDKIFDVAEKYYAMIFEELDNVEKADGVFTANGVSQNCTVLTANVTQRQFYSIIKKILVAVKDDSDIKSLVKDVFDGYGDSLSAYGVTFDALYSEMQSSIQMAIDEFEGYDQYVTDDTMLSIVDYAADGEIIGRDIKLSGFGSDPFEIFFGNAKSDGKFGTELTVNGVTYLSGSGTVDGAKLTGALQLAYGGRVLGTLTLTDFDYQENIGTMEIALSQDVWREMVGSSTASVLSSASLKITLTDSETVFDVMIGGMSALKATATEGAKESVAVDSGKAAVDVESWSSTLDLTAIYNRLQSAGVPMEMLSSLASAMY